MKRILLLVSIAFSLFAREITTNEVYSQALLLRTDVNYILDSYGVKHNDKLIDKQVYVHANLKPRNSYQKTYEIMIKANILRQAHGMVAIQPVNVAPILHLNPGLVYGQVRRLLTEFRLFEIRSNIKQKIFKAKKFHGKSPIDVFNLLSAISATLDLLNGKQFTPSYVFAQNIRVYSDLTLILNKLDIEDDTIPSEIDTKATPNDTFLVGMKMLEKIKQLQILSGINFVDFTPFERKKATPSDVFMITEMIIAELQTIKAYLGIEDVTVPAYKYSDITPVEVDQLMNWNLRKLRLINNITKGAQE